MKAIRLHMYHSKLRAAKSRRHSYVGIEQISPLDRSYAYTTVAENGGVMLLTVWFCLLFHRRPLRTAFDITKCMALKLV